MATGTPKLARVAARDSRADPPIRIMLRPVGSPLPLGLFAFAIGSLTFSTLEIGWIEPSQARPIAIMMLAFVVPLQLITGVIAFWARDAGGATALGLFSMSWAAMASVTLEVSAPTVPALGVLLLGLAAVMVALGIASLAGKPVFSVVLVLACARFLTTAVYELQGDTVWERAAGWLGLPLSAAALYLGLALLLEDLQHQTVLPLFRRGAARTSLESHLGDQVSFIEREAGVRQQL
jgi:succinate-acetate transporter protein